MTRKTLHRPPTEQILDPQTGELNQEWQFAFDELYSYLADKQKTDEATLASESGVSEQIENYVNLQIAQAIAAITSDEDAVVPVITTYSEEFTMTPSTILTVNHNLDTLNPLWSVRMDDYSARTFVLYGTGDPNSHDLRWSSAVNETATITLYKIDLSGG